MKAPVSSNVHDTREGWLRAATGELRGYFEKLNHKLPADIRYAIAFPSTGKRGKRKSECWHAKSSGDGHYEIFLRADLAEPVTVLGALVKELIHTTLPDSEGHGKLFKAAALEVGLQGPMREATPGVALTERLTALAERLGPLPHQALNIGDDPLTAVAPSSAKAEAEAKAVALGGEKKQKSRRLKAECSAEGCGFLVSVTREQVRKVGVPHCPKHGAMHVSMPPEELDANDAETKHDPDGRG